VNIQTNEIRLYNFLYLPIFFHHSGPDILGSLISKVSWIYVPRFG